MDWLRSWVTTPEQRCSENIQKILQTGELSESEWATLYSDIQSNEVPHTLITGLPGLVEAMQQRVPSSVVTVCHLLTVIAKAASVTGQASVLVDAESVQSVWTQWNKDAVPEVVVETFAVLRNLLLLRSGGDAFMSINGSLDRVCAELTGGASASKIEARIHLLSMLANLTSTNEFAAFQMVERGHLASLSQKFQGNTNRFAIAVVYNVLLWENCRRVIQSKGTAVFKDALVTALGGIVLSDCDGKSLEYRLAARIIKMLDSEAESEGLESSKPVSLPWTGQPIFQV